MEMTTSTTMQSTIQSTMEPKLVSMNTYDDTLEFTLENLELSFANALRRTILSDIPVVCFKTYPEKENQCKIQVNTSKHNNEIIKQRLSCIPIHITDENFPLETYELVVEKENNTNNTIYVTTEDFKIRNILNDKYLTEEQVHKIFPPNKKTKQYIDFVRLRPRLSDDIPGEQLMLTCKFSKANAKVDGMFNVASTCSYGFTMDNVKVEKIWEMKENELRKEKIDDLEIANEKKNFMLLDAERITKSNSYDFIVETIGIYENTSLIKNACKIIQTKLMNIQNLLKDDEIGIQESQTSMDNCYDVKLTNEDYTIGKLIENMLHSTYITQENVMSFCGFKKFHPHDDYSIIRVAYNDKISMSEIKEHIVHCCTNINQVFDKIVELF